MSEIAKLDYCYLCTAPYQDSINFVKGPLNLQLRLARFEVDALCGTYHVHVVCLVSQQTTYRQPLVLLYCAKLSFHRVEERGLRACIGLWDPCMDSVGMRMVLEKLHGHAQYHTNYNKPLVTANLIGTIVRRAVLTWNILIQRKSQHGCIRWI